MKSSQKYFILAFVIFMIFGAVFVPNTTLASGNASLFFDVAGKTFTKGDTLNINIKVNSSDKKINAVSGSFKIPKNFQLQSIETSGSFLDFWVNEPKVSGNILSFQGVAIKNPYQGSDGLIFSIKGVVTAKGTLSFNFKQGSILADDGLGTDVLGVLKGVSLVVKDVGVVAEKTEPNVATAPALVPTVLPPVINSNFLAVDESENFSLKGKGVPNALTEINFENTEQPSWSEKIAKFFTIAVRNEIEISHVDVQNDKNGAFSYEFPSNLVAGVYNVVPSYIDSNKNINIQGKGTQIYINENTICVILIAIINTLILVIPALALIIIILFLFRYLLKILSGMRHKKSKSLE
jgi:hypothetical protein